MGEEGESSPVCADSKHRWDNSVEMIMFLVLILTEVLRLPLEVLSEGHPPTHTGCKF